MTLDSIISVSITTLTTSISRAGFGTPLLVAYFPTSVFSDRVREYGSLTEMTDDGFLVTDQAYLMASAFKAQNPSVSSWKVGRKALPSVQTFTLTPTITTEGEVLRITVEGTEISYTIPSSATVNSIATAMAALIDAVVGVTGTDATGSVTITPNRVTETTLTVDTADNEEDFTVTINGTAYTYTSDTSATVTEIRDGIKALIDADGSAAVTTTSVSTDQLTLTATTHYGVEVLEAAGGTGAMSLGSATSAYDLLSIADVSDGLTIKDNTPNPGIATDLAAIAAEDLNWYGLFIDSESEAEINATATWAETQTCIFGASCIDSEMLDSGTATDVASDLNGAGYDRTYCMYSVNNQQYQAARWSGVMLPKDPGSATWSFKKLAGATVAALSVGEIAALDGKKCNYYHSVGGASITQKGYAASGEWVDTTRGVDWFKARLQERLYDLFVNNDKLPYNDATQTKIHNAIRAQLAEAVTKGVCLPDTTDTPWVISVPDPADISSTDKNNRLWPDIEWSAYLAGAVHSISMQGVLSV